MVPVWVAGFNLSRNCAEILPSAGWTLQEQGALTLWTLPYFPRCNYNTILIPITYHCKSTTTVLNIVPTTDNQHFFVIYFVYFLKKQVSAVSNLILQLRNKYVKVHLAIVFQWLGQYLLLNKLGV
jgi:hypothetical protein